MSILLFTLWDVHISRLEASKKVFDIKYVFFFRK
jgi:hypothetical protein